MAGKNQVTLTFAGDNDQLTKVFADTGSAADKMADKVGDASKRMATEMGGASGRVREGTRGVTAGYARAAEATDTLDTRSMGFRDTLTGVQDSMRGTAALAKGDLFNGLFLAGMGIGDLASGATNLLVPALKSAHAGLLRARDATLAFISTARGATLAMGAVGIALAAAGAIYLAFKSQTDQVEVSTDKLVDDLERLERSGRSTGEIVKLFGDDASNVKDQIVELSQAMAEVPMDRNDRDFLNNMADMESEAGKLKEQLAPLDDALARVVSSGGDGEAALRAWANAMGLSDEEMKHVIEALPQYRDELERATEKERDANEVVLEHTASLDAFASALRAQTDPVFAFARAQEQLTAAQTAVNEAQAEFGAGSDEHERALLGLAQAELGLSGAAAGAAASVGGSLLPMLERMRDDGLLSEGAFRALKREINAAGREADRVDGTRTRFHVQTYYQRFFMRDVLGFFGQSRQHGGHATGMTLVGEDGPELVRFNRSAEVINNSSSRRLAQQIGDGAGAAAPAVIEIRSGGSRLDDALVEILSRAVAARGGNVQLALGRR